MSLFGSILVDFAVPIYVGRVVNDLGSEAPIDDKKKHINKNIMALSIIIVVSSFSAWARGYSFNLMSQRIGRELRYHLFRSITTKDISFFDENKTGDLVSRISSDCEKVQDGLSTNISMAIRGVVSIVISLGFLIYISWVLTLALVAMMLPVTFFVIWYGKKTKALGKEIQDKTAVCTTVAEESFTHIRTVKAFSTEDYETKKYADG